MRMERGMHAPPSPCRSVCQIDEATGWCLGCRRTLSEIADWPMLSSRDKRSLLEALDQRSVTETGSAQ